VINLFSVFLEFRSISQSFHDAAVGFLLVQFSAAILIILIHSFFAKLVTFQILKFVISFPLVYLRYFALRVDIAFAD